MKKFSNPEGTNDLLLQDCVRKMTVQERLQKNLLQWGYNRIETPMLEYLDLFSESTSPIHRDNILKLVDRDGKILVLRPDLTIPAARVVSTKLRKAAKPLRIFYCGSVYRFNGQYTGKQREFTQVGAELYGDDGIWSDVELVGLANSCLLSLGLKEYKIDLGHAGIFDGICESLNLPEDAADRLKELIRNKNLVELEHTVSWLEVDDKTKDMICRLPCLFGNPESVFKNMDDILINDRVKASVEHLQEVYLKLSCMGLAANLCLDMGMTGSIEYYTGFIMRGYVQGVSSAVLSGGRYDKLLSEFDYDCPAAGFALYVDRLAGVAGGIGADNGEKILVCFDDSGIREAQQYAAECRSKGATAVLFHMQRDLDADAYIKEYGLDSIVSFCGGERGNCLR